MEVGLNGPSRHVRRSRSDENFVTGELTDPRIQLFVQDRIDYLGKFIFN